MESEMDKYRRLVLHATWFLHDTSTLLQNSCIKLNEVAFGCDSNDSAAYILEWKLMYHSMNQLLIALL